MSDTAEANMSPSSVAATLEGLETYEERLTTRAAGMTWMIWGLVGPAIFMTYNAASPWTAQAGLGWLGALLWAPWVAGGTLLTQSLWRSQSLTLQREPDTETRWGWLISLGYTGLFFAIAGVLLWLVGTDSGINVLMTLVLGVFTMAISAGQRLRYEAASLTGVAVGAALVLVGVGMAMASIAGTAAGLIGASSALVLYFAYGGSLYLKG